ncbi:small EDRK-rich factor 1-like [Dromiciops gliroides]|uniref:small EDRK-rich factor 1-like n=1 Tax=Dromiciops gliroides TaxID=33562 RepID=UPI001CC6C5F2|nr:small EDRK-rich factor 1-like [Dromiciops gliroides]
MAHGNQQVLAHQKNMKKTQEISKGKKRREFVCLPEKEIMQQKQKAANEKKSLKTDEKNDPQ